MTPDEEKVAAMCSALVAVLEVLVLAITGKIPSKFTVVEDETRRLT
jgi:hypothetical protein